MPDTNDRPAALPAGAGDFDFIHGSWRVHHRRLRERLVGCTDWVEFGGTMHADPILGGLGNFDRNVIDQPEGRYEACTLRLFRPDTGQWSLHWIDGRDPGIDPPLFGRFENGIGVFHGDDNFRGQPIRLRFHWQQPTPSTARWDQAFSADGGATWETNWIMEFNRA
ncbi:MAG: DUF1579 domain-containing protein [Sphingomonas sp.]|uniref:DUF1579 domain-containing protein n=1 Tax=Sphingomonas sp. TaxID=28214 RepID=UPI003F81E7B3